MVNATQVVRLLFGLVAKKQPAKSGVVRGDRIVFLLKIS